MANKTTITTAIFEETTRFLTATIEDEDGDGFKPEALTLLLYDVETGQVVNSRNRVSVLDANGGAVTAGGVLTMELLPADNVIVGSRTGKTSETHRALFEWTWASGTRKGKHEVEFTIEENSQVP